MLICQLEVCQEGGGQEGTWRMLRVPDWKHGGYGQNEVFYPKEDALKISCRFLN